MKLFGKEYGLYLSVGAAQSIANVCPGEDISNVGELFNGTYTDLTNATFMMALVMNKAHEDLQKMLNPEYEPNYLTSDLLKMVTPGDFATIQNDVIEAFKEGQKRTVETEPVEDSSKNATSGEEH